MIYNEPNIVVCMLLAFTMYNGLKRLIDVPYSCGSLNGSKCTVVRVVGKRFRGSIAYLEALDSAAKSPRWCSSVRLL